MENTIYDLAILGGGPAGVAAGIYAARKKIKTILVTKDFMGQSVASENIRNWIGTSSISGMDLAKNMEKHLRDLAEDMVDIKNSEMIEKVVKTTEGLFSILTNKNQYLSKTILIATGSARRKFEAPGAAEFEHRGLTYCATCDAPMYGGQPVAVLGGGNSALEAAMQLTAYADKITVIHRRDEFRADPVTVEKVLAEPKITALMNTEVVKINGDKFVNGITVKNKTTGETSDLAVTGIFVEIGHLPNVKPFEGLVNLNEQNSIVVNPHTQSTSCIGAWAAGDCTDGLYKQNNIAVGDAVKALEDIYIFLKTK
ncbi:MAG: FAD-dependent oxidoreductase [bacterium]